MLHRLTAAASIAAAVLSGCAKPPASGVHAAGAPAPNHPAAEAPLPPAEGPVPPAEASLTPIAFADIPGWKTDHLSAAFPAWRAQCGRLPRLPAATVLGGRGVVAAKGGTAASWTPACIASLTLAPNNDKQMRRFIETWFQPYRIEAAASLTGYYEPEVEGAQSAGGPYQTPLLARPADLVQKPPPPDDPNGPPTIGRLVDGQLGPYWTRREIGAGALGGRARPLFWLKSPVDLFFLQIQGSGRVRLPDGAVLRVAFDGRNGRPYTPIGRVLIAQGLMAEKDVTMQSLRAWLLAHPQQATDIMNRNENYVFFRMVRDADSDTGPPGAMGVGLTPGRSAAVDRHFVPLGAPLFIDTVHPMTGAPMRQLVLAQDLGTDIQGPARVDLFLGAGDFAANAAGRMHAAGTIYLLLPKSQADGE